MAEIIFHFRNHGLGFSKMYSLLLKQKTGCTFFEHLLFYHIQPQNTREDLSEHHKTNLVMSNTGVCVV